ncbi:MAG TPA: glycosyltransferase [Chromatiaceae bacterium]|nr:glycosyltransferase [Chromatiaceae bacterium]
MTPKVSVIVRTFNREKYIRSTIESILAQTFEDFDLLVWDDGSSDKTVRIVCEYAKKDPRIRITPMHHQGPAKSLKTAISQTFSPYICWVDSDDLLLPTALEQTVAVLENSSSVGVVYTDYKVINENGIVKGYGNRCRIPYSKDRLLIDFMTFNFRLIRREVYNEVGGIDESIDMAEDYDLCLKLSEVTEFRHIRKPLYQYRCHAESLSRQFRYKQIEWAKTVVEHALKRRGLSDRYKIHVEVRETFSLRRKW